MSNVISVLKGEIHRLARKEARVRSPRVGTWLPNTGGRSPS